MATNHPELESCYAQLRAMGYDAAVFDFNFLTDDGKHIHHAPHRARVIITCTENNMHKTYEAVDGEWKREFCDDVRAGMFGPPPKGVPFDEAHAKQLARTARHGGVVSEPRRLWK